MSDGSAVSGVLLTWNFIGSYTAELLATYNLQSRYKGAQGEQRYGYNARSKSVSTKPHKRPVYAPRKPQ